MNKQSKPLAITVNDIGAPEMHEQLKAIWEMLELLQCRFKKLEDKVK